MGTRAAAGTVALMMATVAAAAACQAAGEGGTDPDPTPVSSVDREVSARIGAPEGYRLFIVEFADARHGYASVINDDPVPGDEAVDPARMRHASAVFATTDGGASWRRLPDPRPPSPSPQMYTVDATTLVLSADSEGWYVSTDGGETFRFSPTEPPEMDGLYHPGGVRIDCVDGCLLSVDGTAVDTPLADGVHTAAKGAGRLWAATVSGGAPRTVASADGGRTWSDVPVPAHPAGEVERVRLSAAPDGTDAWLVGSPRLTSGGVGQRAPLRRKEVGVPVLWRWDGQAWLPQGTVGAPSAAQVPYSAVAIGGGLVAAAGPGGLWLIDGAWHATEMYPVPEWVTTLPDGTIFAATSGGVYFLGTRQGWRVNWARVTVEL